VAKKGDCKFTDEELIDLLFVELFDNESSIRDALKTIGYEYRSFYRRLAKEPNGDLANGVEQLRRAVHEKMEDDLLEFADNVSIPADHRRIMVDTRKWILARRSEKFREKKDITTDGKPMLIADL
jgi:hypothetical protein